MSIAPCSVAAAPVHGVVVFDPATFKAAFPQFATVTDGALQMDFTFATLLLNNTCQSIVCDAATREQLLNLLVCHVAALLQGENGNAPAGIVGRVDSASEGSISVSAEYASQIGQSMAYYIQTQYGAMFWQMTAAYRAFRPYAAPQECCSGPGFPGLLGYGFDGQW